MFQSISDSERSVSEDEIGAFEKKNGIRLPQSYRRFLLAHNGGVPLPDVFPLPDHREGEMDVQVFFSLNDGVEAIQLQYNFDLYRERFDEAVFASLFPIASDSFNDRICLDLSEERFGAVVFIDMVPMWKDHTAKDVYLVADSFEAFLEMLYEPED